MTDHARIGRRSRVKGGAFERECAAFLRAWLGPDYDVRRNPADRQRGQGGAGDLVVTGPARFPFAVEAKHVAALRVAHLLAPTALLVGFWRQTSSQASAAGLRPMLLAKAEGRRLAVVRRADAVAMGVGEPCVRFALDGEDVVAAPWDVVERAAWVGVVEPREVA